MQKALPPEDSEEFKRLDELWRLAKKGKEKFDEALKNAVSGGVIVTRSGKFSSHVKYKSYQLW